MTDIEKMVKHATIRERRRAILKQRLNHNIHRHPWISVISPLLLIVLGWGMNWVSIPLPGENSSPLLIFLWNHSVKITVWLVVFLLVMAVLTSAPPRGKTWTVALAHIGFIDKYSYSPALISSQLIGSKGAEQHVFYSKGIGLDKWVERKREIEDQLNITLIEDPSHYDHDGHYVVLIAKRGVDNAPSEQGEPLYDDEL